MNTIYELIKRNILDTNPYKNVLMIELMIENFTAMQRLTLEERQELIDLIHPPTEEVIETI